MANSTSALTSLRAKAVSMSFLQIAMIFVTTYVQMLMTKLPPSHDWTYSAFTETHSAIIQPGQHLLSHYKCLVTSLYDFFLLSYSLPCTMIIFHRLFLSLLKSSWKSFSYFSGIQSHPDVHNLYNGLCHPHRQPRGDSSHLVHWNSEESANNNTQEAKEIIVPLTQCRCRDLDF